MNKCYLCGDWKPVRKEIHSVDMWGYLTYCEYICEDCSKAKEIINEIEHEKCIENAKKEREKRISDWKKERDKILKENR